MVGDRHGGPCTIECAQIVAPSHQGAEGDWSMSASAKPGLSFEEALIFERGTKGRHGASLPDADVPRADAKALLGGAFREQAAPLPEVSEPEAFRHFVRLSQQNFAIDLGMYPLGSCTMKYNPKVNEWA